MSEADQTIEWASGNIGEKAEWSHGKTSDGLSYHKVWKQDQLVFREHNEQAQWGNVVSLLLLVGHTSR